VGEKGTAVGVVLSSNSGKWIADLDSAARSFTATWDDVGYYSTRINKKNAAGNFVLVA
jgi:hypothetical protein